MGLCINYRSDRISDALSTLVQLCNLGLLINEILDPEIYIQVEKTNPRRRNKIVYKEKRLDTAAVDSDFLYH